MERFFGAVGRSLRTILPRVFPNVSSGEANMSRTQYVHLARVKEAMDSLAPKGQALPSQGRALASEAATIEGDGRRTPAEIVAAANALFQGDGVAQDKAKAFGLWRQAARSGHPSAMYSYASCLRNGEGTERDLGEAVSIFEQLASSGMREAQYALGLVLSSDEGEDIGIARDEERARDLFVTAAKAGFVPAINNAASMMASGKGGEKDEAKAVRWYEVAVDTGDPAACYTLATWYCAGRAGLEEDWEKGYELHKRAAAMGLPQAQFNTGVHFFLGKGVEQDLPEAARWFEKAAERGMPEAMMNLAKMTAKGMGVARNRERALELYLRAGRFGGGGQGQDAELDDAVVAELVNEMEKGDEPGKTGNGSSSAPDSR